MSILPALGTSYKSLDAFKLDVQGRGDLYSLRYSTRDSKKDQHLQLNCSESRVESTCSSRVIARRSDHGDFRVTNVNQVHSCQETRGGEAEWEGIESNRKQSRLDDEEQDNFEETTEYDDCDVRVRQSRSDSEDEWKGDVAGSESEESTSTGSEDSDSSTSSDSSNTLKKAKGDRKKDEGKKSTASTRFPPARDLRNEIAKLAVRPVSFPSPTQSFSEPPHQLLATLHAFAQQNGFSLYRRNNNKTTLQLNCSLNHTRNNKKPGGRCKFTISARRDQDGRWKVLPLTTQHNHNLSSTSTLPISTVGAPATVGSIPSRPPSQILPGYSSLASHLQPVPAAPTYRYSFPVQPQSFALSNTAASPNLASLLRAFHPSFEAQHSLDYFNSIGVDSVETLTQLIMMENEGFERSIGGIETEIGKIFRMIREDLQQELAK